MRFNVEKTFLKQVSDRPSLDGDHVMTLIQTEAEDISDALNRVIARDDTELVDEVHWLPGSQAVTAVREGSSVYMLQVFPVADELDDEEEERESMRLYGVEDRDERR